MLMGKKILIAMAVLLCSFAPDALTDKRIMDAIEEQLPKMLMNLRGGDEKQYGFREDDDIDECFPGKPCRLLVFSNEFYTTDSLEEDKNYLVIKNEWRVPLKMKGINRNMLTVTGFSGNYVIGKMGDTTVAQDLQGIGKSNKEEDTYYLLSIPRLNAYFFVQESDNSLTEAQFKPLASTIARIPALDNPVKDTYSLTEMQAIVKKALLTPNEMPVVPKKKKAAVKGK